jgi:hypothetical protein
MSRIYMKGSSTDREKAVTLGSDDSMKIRLCIGASAKNSEEILTIEIEEVKKGHYFISADGRAATEMGASGNLNISVKEEKEDNK